MGMQRSDLIQSMLRGRTCCWPRYMRRGAVFGTRILWVSSFLLNQWPGRVWRLQSSSGIVQASAQRFLKPVPTSLSPQGARRGEVAALSLDLAQEASSCWWGCPEILQISDSPDQPEVKGVQGQRNTFRGVEWRMHSWEVPLALVLG